jgi:hypothetical protein
MANLHRPPSGLPPISPSREEICLPFGFRHSQTSLVETTHMTLPISPLEGEMSGRTEGGRLRLRSASVEIA